MIMCPNCGEMVGNNVDTCFNCSYDFKLRRVPSRRETYALSEEERQMIKEEEEEKFKKRLAEINAQKPETLLKNAYYEYRTEYLFDDASGELRKRDLDDVLGRYAADGWRLHTMAVNEVGKNETTVGVGGFSNGVNATLDVTILVFERCIKPAEF